MKTLGVITTTYNRGYCIGRVYKSLVSQSNKDFKWLIIDDGSTDNTRELINNFISERLIEIIYVYQENKGMTQARNKAYESIDTEINIIIDSDDWMENEAVDNIIEFWNSNKNNEVSGIIALNRKINEGILDSQLPNGIKQTTLTDLHQKYKCKGDKKLIYRTEISKLYPYPYFEGEKYFPASYKFKLIDQDYEMLLMDKVVCVVDFNENGATFSRVKQYKTCANGFSFYRNEMMRISNNPKYIMKEAIHYISASKFANKKGYVLNSSKKAYVILLYPIGLIFHLFIKKTKRKSLTFRRK